MSKRNKIIIGVVAVLFIVALVIVNLKQSSGKTFPVQVEKVSIGKLVHLVSGTGKIQPEIAVRISANVSARIIKLHAIEGERIKKDQILVELDRTRYEASVVQAQASLSSSKANARQQEASMQQALSEYNRTKNCLIRVFPLRENWRILKLFMKWLKPDMMLLKTRFLNRRHF